MQIYLDFEASFLSLLLFLHGSPTSEENPPLMASKDVEVNKEGNQLKGGERGGPLKFSPPSMQL